MNFPPLGPNTRTGDIGFFGPESVSWQVLGRRSVILGGMRALLMQAVHPLVDAATAQAGGYQRDPWQRHRRTVELTFDLIFGSRRQASAAARRINAAHRAVAGRDPLTGRQFRAGDHDLLLWVHATLVSSFLRYERLTVGRLDARGRQRFCAELAFMSHLLGLPPGRVPDGPEAIESYIETACGSGILRPTDSARVLAGVIRRPARGTMWIKLRTAGFLAFHTLPEPVRVIYGVDHDHADERRLAVVGAVTRVGQRALPARSWSLPRALAATRSQDAADARQSVH